MKTKIPLQLMNTQKRTPGPFVRRDETMVMGRGSRLIWLCLLILLGTESVHATQARRMGMGGLAFVLEDESNDLNLYDFGSNTAGLLDDHDVSVLRSDLGVNRFNQKYGEVHTIWGCPHPLNQGPYWPAQYEAQDTILPPLGLTVAHPIEGIGAVCASVSYSTHKSELYSYDSVRRQDTRTPAGTLSLIARLPFGVSLGMSGGIIDEEQPETYHLKLRVVEAEVGIQTGQRCAFGLSASREDGSLDYLGTWWPSSDKYEGNGYSLGCQGILSMDQIVSGTKFHYRRIATDITPGTWQDTDLYDCISYEIHERAIWSISPTVHVGVSGGYHSLEPRIYWSPPGRDWEGTGGGGIALHRSDRIMGAEFQYWEEGKRRGFRKSTWEVRIGAEQALDQWLVRGGIARHQSTWNDLSLDEGPEQMTSLSMGLGRKLLQGTVDIALRVASGNHLTEWQSLLSTRWDW
jgi:hypothetical protein